MKKLILIAIITFSTNGSCEWVNFATNTGGSEYFYDKDRVSKLGHNIFVWVRTKYAEGSKYGDWSSEVYQQINCREYTFKYIHASYYKDNNWKHLTATEGKQPKMGIPPGSAIQYLSEIICR